MPDHPFYAATLFVPQVGSLPGRPHPLLVAFVKAGREFRSNGPEASRSVV